MGQLRASRRFLFAWVTVAATLIYIFIPTNRYMSNPIQRRAAVPRTEYRVDPERLSNTQPSIVGHAATSSAPQSAEIIAPADKGNLEHSLANFSSLSRRSRLDDQKSLDDWRAAGENLRVLMCRRMPDQGNMGYQSATGLVSLQQPVFTQDQVVHDGWERHNADAASADLLAELGTALARCEAPYPWPQGSCITWDIVGGSYTNCYSHGGVILNTYMRSPRAPGASRYSGPPPAEPDIYRWSDITFTEWYENQCHGVARVAQNVQYFLVARNNNEWFLALVKIYFGISMGGRLPQFDQARELRLSDTGEDGDWARRFLASPVGRGPAWFLIQHKTELGPMEIYKIRVFGDGTQPTLDPHHDYASMLLYVRPVASPSRQQTGRGRKSGGNTSDSGCGCAVM